MSRRLTTISKFCEERAPSLAESNLLMATTIYLSKVLGISLVIIGAVIMIRRRYFVPVFGAFVRERLVRAITAIVELLAGIFLVVGHNVWSPPPAAIISLLGWIAVIEATAYLLLPDDVLETVVSALNTAAVYLFGGLLAIAIGIYLMGFGFGWW